MSDQPRAHALSSGLAMEEEDADELEMGPVVADR